MNRSKKCVTLILALAVISFSCLRKPELPRSIDIRIFNKYKIHSVAITSINELTVDGSKASSVSVTANNSGYPEILIDKKKAFQKKIKIHSRLMKVSVATETKNFTRSYSDEIQVYLDNRDITLINRTDINTYAHNAAMAELRGFIDISDPKGWELEMLKAQETAIRSYTANAIPRHRDYDLCDLTHCCVFYGILNDSEPAAPGEVLYKSGRIITGYFHSTCGGRLRLPSSFWEGESDNGFIEKPDICNGRDLCSASPNYRWRSEVPSKELCGIFGIDKIAEMRSSAGRKGRSTVFIKSDSSVLEIPVSEFISRTGKRLGWNVFKSGYFTSEIRGDRIIVKGSGLGHGVGLCQHGAMALAKEGKNYREILSFYYNADIVKAK